MDVKKRSRRFVGHRCSSASELTDKRMHSGRDCLRRILVRDIQVLTSGGRRGAAGGAPGGRVRCAAAAGGPPPGMHRGHNIAVVFSRCSANHRHDHSVWERQLQPQPRSHSPSPRLTATALELLAKPSAQSPTAPVLEPQLQPWSLGALEPLARGPLSDPGPNLRQSTLGNLPCAPEGPILSRKPIKNEGFYGFSALPQPKTLQKTLKT